MTMKDSSSNSNSSNSGSSTGVGEAKINKKEVDVEQPDVVVDSLKDYDTEAPSVISSDDDSDSSSSHGEANKGAAVVATTSSRKNKKKVALFLVLFVLLTLGAILTGVLVSRAKHEKSTSASSTGTSTGWWGGSRPCPPKDTPPTDTSTTTSSSSQDEPEDLDAATETAAPTIVYYDPPFAQNETTLPPFNMKILDGYATEEDLEADLTIAARRMANRIVQSQLAQWQQSQQQQSHDDPQEPRPIPTLAMESAQSASAARVGPFPTSIAANDQPSDFEASSTNNQERSADEADVLKNDLRYVYAAFGAHLVVYDHTTGETVTQVSMPKFTDGSGEDMDDDFVHWTPPVFINALLLTADHVVIATGMYGQDQHNRNRNPVTDSVLNVYQGTHLRIYTKPSLDDGTMTLVATQDIPGVFRDGRWMQDTQSLQIMTAGDIQTYNLLVEPLTMRHFPQASTPAEFIALATHKADTEVIPTFVRTVSRELRLANAPEIPQMLKVNSWTTKPKAMESDFNGPLQDESMRAFVQIVTLDASTLPVQPVTALTNIHQSVVLTPNLDALLYATDSTLVVAIQHGPYPRSFMAQETTSNAEQENSIYLMSLNVNSTSTAFHSVARVPGHLNNDRYSIDVRGTDVRIATTIQKWFPLNHVWSLCGRRGDFGSTFGSSNGQEYCQTEETYEQCAAMAMDGCVNITHTGCPYSYTCEDALLDTSSTENYVMVLDASEPGTMRHRGQVSIGLQHEVITAVRFEDSFSYAMTFDQRDPFYILDLPQGQAPTIRSMIKLDGFARYLHPLYDEDNQESPTLLVGIGQNTTGTGLNQVNSGVLISIFDVSDPDQPRVVESQMLEDDDSIESYTQAQWDPHTVQYAKGKLIIPLKMHHYHQNSNDNNNNENNGLRRNLQSMGMYEEMEADLVATEEEEAVEEQEEEEVTLSPLEAEDKSFSGFIVLDVGASGISEVFRLSTRDRAQKCHYCNAAFTESRSLLSDDGSLVSMWDNFVVSTNITTGEELWALNVTLDGVEMGCCW